MSWPMPTPGPWNAAMGMPPDMSNYTPDQWQVMQQQNWQQWTQWQQQYAQWQQQYGEKYAQMQAMPPMGIMPPLPVGGVPPPAPPPPDKPPPPPPPHENDQPLYGAPPTQPAPVPAPTTTSQHINTPQLNNTGYTNTSYAGNNQNWSKPTPMTTNVQQLSSQSNNTDALKKLAEEERLFDIQFKKWEEEIEKWKQENVNHPDKQAYKEYESKFEGCRLQLLERRQQMKQKRARLLGTDQSPYNNLSLGNSSVTVPPPQAAKADNYVQNTQPSAYNTNPPINNQLNQQHSNSAPVYKNNNKNIDPQDRYESYQNIEDYSATSPAQSTFLPQANTAKGIPGLDLVPDTDKTASGVQSDVIDMTGDYNESQPNTQSKGPDYNKISKGINSILGDEKIMKMLNMVRGQNVPVDNSSAQQNVQQNLQSYNRPPPVPGQNVPVDNNSAQQNFQQNLQSYNRPPPVNASAHVPYAGMTQNNMPQNNQWGSDDNQPNTQHYPNRQSMPYNNNINNNNNNSRSGPPPLMDFTPFNQRRMFEDQSGMLHGQANERNVGFGQQQQQANMSMPPPSRGGPGPLLDRQNMRPPLQDVSRQQNMNATNSGPMDNRMLANRQGMHENNGMHENYNNRMPGDQPMPPAQPPKPKWVEEPLFTPSIIVEYEHKPLRLKARDFIEPVHMFDYNHKSKDDEYKIKDFESEVEDLFVRKPRRIEDSHFDRDREDTYATDIFKRKEYERRPREELRDDFRNRYELREEHDDKRRSESLNFERRSRFDDRDRERSRREHVRDDYYYRDRERERDRERDRFRDIYHSRSRSRDRDIRKRAHSRESEHSDISKKIKDTESKELKPPIKEIPKHIVMIDDILESPGRETRPPKIVIIMRGPPGSGKSYLAKLIRDREAEYGGTARIMSIDDYFMQEGEIDETDPVTGKTVKKPTMKYEFDLSLEETYVNSLKRAFKRSLTDGYFNFLIYDAVNDQLKSYADIWNYARQCGFQVYICTMEHDSKVCFKRNIHNRTLDDIEVICSRFFPTPAHHIQLDPTTLLQNAAITDVQMEDAIDEENPDDFQEPEIFAHGKGGSLNLFARLDGINKPLRPSQISMEDYLQLDDWKPNQAKPGKKTVRWADIEERREQEKMRAIGFVVGQTDWNRMTDPTMGSSALTQTKFIERVRRN